MSPFRRPDGPACRTCAHFICDRRLIEAAIPNLTVLGSAYASVAADDGLCRRHDIVTSRRAGCADHTAKVAGYVA